MSNHFTAMGIPVRDNDSLREVLTRVLAQPVRTVELPDEATAISWRDLSGAGVDLLVDGTELLCAIPQYLGDGRQSVRVTGLAQDPEGCPGCALVDLDVLSQTGEAVYPLTVVASEVVRRHDDIARQIGEIASASLVFVAELVSVWPDEEGYYADKRAEGLGEPVLGSHALIPVGRFGEGPAQPVVLVNGTVTDVRRRTNVEFGGDFWHVLLRTSGATYDLLVATEDLPHAEAGQVVQAQAWVCGRVGELA